jgi:hypothetical protein
MEVGGQPQDRAALPREKAPVPTDRPQKQTGSFGEDIFRLSQPGFERRGWQPVRKSLYYLHYPSYWTFGIQQILCRPGQALRLPGGSGSQAAFTGQKIFLVLISVRGWVDHSATGRTKSMKNSNDTIGNRNRDLPACNAVPQPAVPPRAIPSAEYERSKTTAECWICQVSG